MMALSKYLPELKTLVDHQAQQSGTVLFRLRVLDDDKSQVIIEAVNSIEAEDRIGDWSLYLSSVDPFAVWEHAGYIRVVTGGLQQGVSIFRLTEGGIAAAKGAPGG